MIYTDAATQNAFAAGSDTPRKFLERCLEVIEARDGAVKAFTALNVRNARSSADLASERWRCGHPLSAVDGMPVGVKDLFETEGLLTEANSPVFEGFVPRRDAACVMGLSALGASVIGKTATYELGGGKVPATVNPLDPARSPGGSSSGSAAAVAAQMVPASLGTQLKGSLLRPASFCGVYAFKPSYGALNRAGSVTGPSSASTLGAMADSLADAWTLSRLLSGAAGPDAGERPLSGPIALPQTRRPKRVGILTPSGWERLPQALVQAFENILDGLRRSQVAVIDAKQSSTLAELVARCPDLDRHHSQICRYEARWPMRRYHELGLLSPDLGRLSTSEDWMTAEDYSAALDVREQARTLHAKCLAEVDLLLTLSAGGVAPIGLTTLEDRSFQVPASLIGAPAWSLPLLRMGGLPVGLQAIGRASADAELTAGARFIVELVENEIPAFAGRKQA